jgi:DNA-binding transcriptional LysR family regulator
MTPEINPKQLKVFYHVARSLSFRKAADDLFVTQPAARMQVDALEEHCGAKFLSREGRKLELTEAGHALYRYAERLVELLSEAEQTISNIKSHPRGSLRLGTTKTWARYLMPLYMLRFHRLYPELDIQLEEGSSNEMALNVSHGLNDIAIVGRVAYDDDLEVIPFPGQHADELVLVVRPDHPLAGRETISAEDLKSERLILKEKGSGTREVTDQHFRAKGFEPSTLLEASSAPFIKDLVRRGAGISILTYLSIEEEERQGRLVGISFEDEGLWLNIDIVLKGTGHRSGAAREFLGFLLENGEDLLAGGEVAT